MIMDARHRRDQRLLQEAELAVPQQADAGEDRGEQHRHPDDAGRDELEVAALAGLLEDGPEAEAQRQQVQQRLAERRDDLRARARVALQLAQPQDVNRRSSAVPSTSSPSGASGRAESAASSRMVDAGQREERLFERVALPVCCFSSADVPCATILPWSMMAMRCATRSASSM